MWSYNICFKSNLSKSKQVVIVNSVTVICFACTYMKINYIFYLSNVEGYDSFASYIGVSTKLKLNSNVLTVHFFYTKILSDPVIVFITGLIDY